MESIPSQLPTGRDSNSSPNSKQELQPYSSTSSLKPNQVSETALYGVPIVSLVIDGQERLCLAQISNTLLKNYSYNEIHNRRVALGITCVQCTPVQLEILRRAGAMPISSRRCGMITKREAERLCKSFLGAHSPPKLPENFAFDVSHECAWGSRGSFIPARYNSSRAKCIKCTYCNMYFSPNKFIFHSHRTPESKYTQPDAANFNSWRRHLKLTDKSISDDVAHAWEDVKAMFNGGSRKRTLPIGASERTSPLKPPSSGSLPQSSSPEIPHKTMRCEEDRDNLSLANSVRSYPVIPVPSKSFGMLQKIPPPLFPHPYGFPAFGLCQKKDDGVGIGEQNKTNLSGVFWPGAKDSVYPSFPMFWPATGSLPIPPYPQSQPKPPTELLSIRQNEQDTSEQSDRSTNTPKDSLLDSERCSSTQSTRNEEDKSGDETRSMEGVPIAPRKISYISAFRPVVKDAESIAKLYGNREAYNGARSGYLSPDFMSESSSYRSVSPDADSAEEPDVDVESNRMPEDEESLQLSVEDHQSPPALVISQVTPEKNQEPEPEPIPAPEDSRGGNFSEAGSPGEERRSEPVTDGNNHASLYEVYARERDDHMPLNVPANFGPTKNYQCGLLDSNDSHKEDISSTTKEMDLKKTYQDQGSVSKESPREPHAAEEAVRSDVNRVPFMEKDFENMAKDELQRQLVEQVELRKKLEREFRSLKDNFQDQMKRELSYREEMVQQLQIVRDTLCSELDQERKARYAIQQKLKAHDALHHFSCKMLTPRHCTGTCSFKPPLLPP
ncbi:SKI family transcriptional corepressor 1 homolog-B-like isoform X2 [Brienomyrus brachyistius]|uniref:SKI family transcriptional corepressor 1 homolog-B-like isoform X2 n=1 Tax=Brienomyrus brachyistius TaxID=42636 RepID=UPI0020B2E87B|nr:SKI family transcriptional corepressor 1 homolog-B-like isoform X2 [Brienomyrus brachyistius]